MVYKIAKEPNKHTRERLAKGFKKQAKEKKKKLIYKHKVRKQKLAKELKALK